MCWPGARALTSFHSLQHGPPNEHVPALLGAALPVWDILRLQRFFNVLYCSPVPPAPAASLGSYLRRPRPLLAGGALLDPDAAELRAETAPALPGFLVRARLFLGYSDE